ncbi:UNVERIFIED_ORG: hypothetical protein B2H93_18235 [Clostridium botulinum]
MKAIINTESLLTLIRLVKTDNYQVTVKNKEVKLIGTEKHGDNNVYQVVMREECFGTEEEGTIVIPKQAIMLLPKKSNCIIEDNIIKTENQEIKIATGRDPVEEVEVDSDKCALIPNFKEMSECKYAVSNDTCRQVLQCLYLDSNNLVALDGYRLSIRSSNDEITDKPILIPKYIVDLLKHFKGKEVMALTQNEDYVRVCFGWTSIICKKPKHENGEELKFINYKSLIPKENKIQVKVNAEELAGICNSIVKANKYSCNILLNFNKEISTLITLKNEIGIEYKKYFKADIEGEEISIAVNAKYLLEALKNYKGDVRLYITTNVAPILITNGENKKDLVLPVRLIKY